VKVLLVLKLVHKKTAGIGCLYDSQPLEKPQIVEYPSLIC